MKQRIAVLLMLGMMPWAELHAQQQTATTTFRVTAKRAGRVRSDGDRSRLSALTPRRAAPRFRARRCCGRPARRARPTTSASTRARRPARRSISGKWCRERTALNYQLYSDSARSTIWGNTTGTDTVTGVGTGLAQDHTVFGAVPAAQVVPAGDYADTITVRIYY